MKHLEYYIGRRLGKIKRVSKYWIDIDFPTRPAPTFERSGILIDDKGIYWASEPIDSGMLFNLYKIMWPVAVAKSTWAFTTAMAKQHWAELTKALGYHASPPPPATSQSMVEALARSKVPTSRRQTPDGGSSPVETPPQNSAGGPANKAAGSSSSSSSSSQQQQQQQQQQPGAPRSGGKTNFLKDTMLPHVDGMREMSSGPWLAFREKMFRTWRHERASPPRGSFRVAGTVEVETTRGSVTLDVVSHWDTKTRKFDPRSVGVYIKRFRIGDAH
ncbi:hypothetical protein SODALDRAFT_134797 [Sodiomyces alkalinus F11]|uniref:Uncharacterized protein n=1 Tax=Sodiomyces alkalinus (strain CBS 110278 / VKM F-3762 / F11) TaxID=1314773 RepID=A0A3N2PYZ1_SODAK|nr:hypothetical protein SODALDRAFT_134797 [Sodiomyces alkalinus F11]ROT39646.1 hypothetical protein SODALDRAFT_134797 [Sodiomyces alkalinus F11]